MGAPQQVVASNAMAPGKMNERMTLAETQRHASTLAGALASLNSTTESLPDFALERIKTYPERTRRCRLYRMEKNASSGHDLFSEVWDFVEEPYEISKLPNGELVGTFEGRSVSEVQQKLESYCEQHNYVLTSDWNSRGSI